MEIKITITRNIPIHFCLQPTVGGTYKVWRIKQSKDGACYYIHVNGETVMVYDSECEVVE